MYKPSTITGTNNIPLGKRRLGGSDETEDLAERKAESSVGNSLKRVKEENDQQTGINLTRSSKTCSLLFQMPVCIKKKLQYYYIIYYPLASNITFLLTVFAFDFSFMDKTYYLLIIASSMINRAIKKITDFF
jgi:hypothetical protein